MQRYKIMLNILVVHHAKYNNCSSLLHNTQLTRNFINISISIQFKFVTTNTLCNILVPIFKKIIPGEPGDSPRVNPESNFQRIQPPIN